MEYRLYTTKLGFTKGARAKNTNLCRIYNMVILLVRQVFLKAEIVLAEFFWLKLGLGLNGNRGFLAVISDW